MQKEVHMNSDSMVDSDGYTVMAVNNVRKDSNTHSQNNQRLSLKTYEKRNCDWLKVQWDTIHFYVHWKLKSHKRWFLTKLWEIN
jgi:hypothetical protein